MKNQLILGALCACTLALAQSANAQSTITAWNFTGTVAAPDNSPAATTGTGTAISLGMTNSYTYANGEGPGSTTSDDITKPGTGSQLADYTWRIRGNGNSANSGAGKANGWNNSAPNDTQGAEFEVSTAGFSNINVSLDWYTTGSGVANMQALYTLDDTQSTPVWNVIPQGNSDSGNDFVAVSGNFFANTTPNITLSLGSISGISDDPNFAVEFVSVQPVSGDSNYASTNGDGDYASAAGGNYNNSSGNWSFGNVVVSGQAVPEPSTWATVIAGVGMLFGYQSRRSRRSRAHNA
jgi:hypothetical protein